MEACSDCNVNAPPIESEDEDEDEDYKLIPYGRDRFLCRSCLQAGIEKGIYSLDVHSPPRNATFVIEPLAWVTTDAYRLITTDYAVVEAHLAEERKYQVACLHNCPILPAPIQRAILEKETPKDAFELDFIQAAHAEGLVYNFLIFLGNIADREARVISISREDDYEQILLRALIRVRQNHKGKAFCVATYTENSTVVPHVNHVGYFFDPEGRNLDWHTKLETLETEWQYLEYLKASQFNVRRVKKQR